MTEIVCSCSFVSTMTCVWTKGTSSLTNHMLTTKQLRAAGGARLRVGTLDARLRPRWGSCMCLICSLDWKGENEASRSGSRRELLDVLRREIWRRRCQSPSVRSSPADTSTPPRSTGARELPVPVIDRTTATAEGQRAGRCPARPCHATGTAVAQAWQPDSTDVPLTWTGICQVPYSRGRWPKHSSLPSSPRLGHQRGRVTCTAAHVQPHLRAYVVSGPGRTSG
jgi:hypothetical protein